MPPRDRTADAPAAAAPDRSGPPAPDHEPRRGRPRSAAAERAILDAVVELLESGEPLAGLSIEHIARTAGVGKATIYRRWSDKEALFVDVLRDIEPPEPTVSGTAGLDDLRVLMESLRGRGLAQRSSVFLHNVFAQMKSHPRLWDEYHRTVIAPRRTAFRAAVRRAVALGELRDDLDVELMDDLFLGPMLVRTVHRHDAPLPDDLVDRIIRVLGEGLAPRPRRRPTAGHG
ncbi:TetR/AcrR family transcriptional regulator [Streptomyces sp. DT24]|uniref:TetR/AcrR family transcriptional regulator n=1 Tax=unclassified Streptomyces TaxID=2593676 RepID=UPI0023B993FA|nr:TetR/AcrR family transcriptional regulator [Streptomyces sp. AM 4-1-1]WEH33076.1 TetR/AcrR family transcriptional regulator [Streptomyces sp. AM 4-1-1]